MDNPLLRHDCEANAPSRDNELIPKPSIVNIIGSSVGRAMKEHPINIHAFEGNINHIHTVFSAREEQIGNVPKFFQHANSLIAREVNKTWKREGALFNRARVESCQGNQSAEDRVLYALNNPVKDGLIEKTKESPFLSTFMHQSQGDTLRFWYIDWAAYWKAGGSMNSKHHPKDYLEWTTWETTPLPHLADLTVHQQRTRIRKLVRENEEHHKQARKLANQTVIGVPDLFRIDPRSRPANPKVSSSQPLCHADSDEEYYAYEERWHTFLDNYIEASFDYRDGDWERLFPSGSFRPPLIRIINDDGT